MKGQNKSTETGRQGEFAAKEYLLSQGYEVLEMNWRFKKYEVDIIAKKADILVFVEVKTRKSNIFGEPEVFVTRKKQQFLIAAANHYVMERNLAFESRFDIIALVSENNDQTVKHLQGAFYPLVR
jgi:putative endonuclease